MTTEDTVEIVVTQYYAEPKQLAANTREVKRNLCSTGARTLPIEKIVQLQSDFLEWSARWFRENDKDTG